MHKAIPREPIVILHVALTREPASCIHVSLTAHHVAMIMSHVTLCENPEEVGHAI